MVLKLLHKKPFYIFYYSGGICMQSKQFDWMPTEAHLHDSRIGRFMQKYGISSCQELIERSNTDLHWFWNAIMEDLGFEWHTPYDKLLNDQLGMPWAKWFLG